MKNYKRDEIPLSHTFYVLTCPACKTEQIVFRVLRDKTGNPFLEAKLSTYCCECGRFFPSQDEEHKSKEAKQM